MLSKSALKSRASRGKFAKYEEHKEDMNQSNYQSNNRTIKQSINQSNSYLFESTYLSHSPMLRSIPSTTPPSRTRSLLIDQSITNPDSGLVRGPFGMMRQIPTPQHLLDAAKDAVIYNGDGSSHNPAPPVKVFQLVGSDSDDDGDLPHEFESCILCNSSLTPSEPNEISFLQFFDLLCIVFDYLPLSQVFQMARICPKWKQILAIRTHSQPHPSIQDTQSITNTHATNQTIDSQSMNQSNKRTARTTGLNEKGDIAPYVWQAIEDTVAETLPNELARARKQAQSRNDNRHAIDTSMNHTNNHDVFPQWTRATRPRIDHFQSTPPDVFGEDYMIDEAWERSVWLNTARSDDDNDSMSDGSPQPTNRTTNQTTKQPSKQASNQPIARLSNRVRDQSTHQSIDQSINSLASPSAIVNRSHMEEKSEDISEEKSIHQDNQSNNRSIVQSINQWNNYIEPRGRMFPHLSLSDSSNSKPIDSAPRSTLSHHMTRRPVFPSESALSKNQPLHINRFDHHDHDHSVSQSTNQSIDYASLSSTPTSHRWSSSHYDHHDEAAQSHFESENFSFMSPLEVSDVIETDHLQWSNKSYLARVTTTSLSTSTHAQPVISHDMIASLSNLESLHLYSPFNPANLSNLENIQFLYRIWNIEPPMAELCEMWNAHTEAVCKARDRAYRKTVNPATISPVVIEQLRKRRTELIDAQPKEVAVFNNATQQDDQSHQDVSATRSIRNPSSGLHYEPNRHVNHPTNNRSNHHIDAHAMSSIYEDPPGLLQQLALCMHIRRTEHESRITHKSSACSLLLPAASRLTKLIFSPESLLPEDLISISQLVSLTSLSLLPLTDTNHAIASDLVLVNLCNLTTLHVAGNRNGLVSSIVRQLRHVPQLTALACHVSCEFQANDMAIIVSSCPQLCSLTISTHSPINNRTCEPLLLLKHLSHLELFVPWSTSFELPTILFELTTLETLNLCGALATRRSGLPKALMTLENLHSLSIRGCFDTLNAIVDTICQMPKIKHLDFTNSPLTSSKRDMVFTKRPDIILKSH